MHIIDQMTLTRINVLDNMKLEFKQIIDQTMIELNNIKLNIFPETIREIQKLLNIGQDS